MANMTNDTFNTMVNEAIDKATTDALNEDTTLDRIKKWAKKHKRELIFGGVVVAATACGIHVYKKRKICSDNQALVDTLNAIKDDHDSKSELYKKYEHVVPSDDSPDALMWWVEATDTYNNTRKYINAPVDPSDFGDSAEKVVEGITKHMSKVFEIIDPNDIPCINIMMYVPD